MSERDKRPEDLLAGHVLAGRYRIRQIAGRGGFSTIYTAGDDRSGDLVCVKQFCASGVHLAGTGQPLDEEQQERLLSVGREHLLQEERMLRALSGTAGIPLFRDAFTEDGTLYLVREYLSGMSCDEYLSRFHGKIPYPLVSYVLHGALQTLTLVHERQMLHADISPINLFVCADASVRLIDWGAAVDLQRDRHARSFNHAFSSPEQSAHQELDPRSDLYSLCASAYQMVTGVLPPDSTDLAAGAPLIPVTAHVPGIPAFLNAIILRGMAVDPDERWQSAEELQSELDSHIRFSVSGAGTGFAAVHPELIGERRSLMGILLSRFRR